MTTPRNQIMKIIDQTRGWEQYEEDPIEIENSYLFYPTFRRKTLKSGNKIVNLQKPNNKI